MDTTIEKVATFHSHYGAMLFKKRLNGVTLIPVPRSLSSSCGTAALFSGDVPESAFDENLEAIYIKEGKGYKKIYG